MNRHELEKWLGESDDRAVALGELAALLHVVIDASRQSVAFTNTQQLRELRFAIAILRDVFPRDEDVRAWLRAPQLALDEESPGDLLSAGRVREFVDLAVAEWNRPRPPVSLRLREVPARL